MATKTPHCWSKEALLAKAQRFFEEMMRHPRDDWQYAHWSTLSLELLGRAALANISPALLAVPADDKNWHSLYFALGHTPKVKKFVPNSIGIAAVFNRLGAILTDFTPDMEGFAILHMNRRNEELHSGDAPFDALSGSSWQPSFFEACTVLAASVGSSLELLLGKSEAALASKMIAASRDESAKAIQKAVAAHKTVWDGKSVAERTTAASQSAVWATRQQGHRVKCPSCDCDALVHGVPHGEPFRNINDDDITETQQYLPTRFECVACGLKISTLAQLTACGLGDTYKSTSEYSAAEYYASNDQYPEYEEDNNEP